MLNCTPKHRLEQFVQQSKTRTEVLDKLGWGYCGNYYSKLDDLITEYKIDTSHFIKKKNKAEIDGLLTKDVLIDLLSRHGSVFNICKELKINYTHYNKHIKSRIEGYGLKLDISKIKGNWIPEEDDLVLKNYTWLPTKQLQNLFPDRTWTAIKLRGEKLGLERLHNPYRKSNLSKLLQDNYLSYYWLGFLMADGHFAAKRLKLDLSTKDMNHLKKFADFIECPNFSIDKWGKKCAVAAMDRVNIPLIKEKFAISNNKTYFPCNIKKIENKDWFISWIIGFIDGDGCIKKQTGRKDCAIAIKCHSSWLENLQLISDRLCLYCGTLKPNKAIINRRGYARINFTNYLIVNFLKNKTKEFELPVLSRKWDLIDLALKNRNAISKENRENVERLYEKNVSTKEICKLLGLKEGCVYQIKRRSLQKPLQVV